MSEFERGRGKDEDYAYRSCLAEEKEQNPMSEQESVPENALFVCFGVMSSAGTLTGVAALEAMKKLDPKKTGLFCTSALAADVPKHKKTTQAAKRIIAVDGCANRCASKIVEKSGFKVDKGVNLGKDLGIEKRGPFRPFDYTPEELQKAVDAIIRMCEEESLEKSPDKP